jgi:hypothetical protein
MLRRKVGLGIKRHSRTFFNVAGGMCFLVVGVFFGVIAWEVPRFPKKLDRYVEAVTPHLVAHDEQIHEFLQTLNQFTKDTLPDSKTNVTKTKDILTQVDALLMDVRSDVIPHVSMILLTTDELLMSLNQDVDKLTQQGLHSMQSLTVEGESSLKALTAALDRVNQLAAVLDKEIVEASPHAVVTLDNMSRALDDLDKVFADPNVAKTLANVEKGTGHVASSAESIDTALLPLRKKSTLLRALILKAIDTIRINPLSF